MGLLAGATLAAFAVGLVFGSGRVAVANMNCPSGEQGCPIAKRDLSRYLNIAGAGPAPSLPYVLRDAFRRKAGARGSELVGYDPGVCDALLLSPNGRYLIYGISLSGWPALDVLDVATGARSLFRARACDPAWGAGGRIAYLRYGKYRSATGGYSGQIVVQHGLTGTAVIWTRTGAWSNPIWAGAALLINAGAGPATPGPLTIFYGPEQSRDVDHQSRGRGPFSTVVAVNPTGSEALLDTQRLGQGGGANDEEDLATLVRTSDGRVLSTAILNGNESSGNSNLTALAPDGSWMGNQVITTDGIFWGGSSHPPATLITLTVTGDQVRLRAVKQFVEGGRMPMAQALDQVTQATFLHGNPQDVAVWFKAIGQIRYVQCDTATDRCTTSLNYAAAVTPTAILVTNPSRP